MPEDPQSNHENAAVQWNVESTEEDSCLLSLKVTPGAKRNFVGGFHDGALKISVTQSAEKGRANKEVLKLLAQAIGVKKSQLQLISGETSRLKKVLCQHVTKKELIQKLNQLLSLKSTK